MKQKALLGAQTISQAELAKYPGEMGARKAAVKAMDEAEQKRIKAEIAATHSGPRYS